MEVNQYLITPNPPLFFQEAPHLNKQVSSEGKPMKNKIKFQKGYSLPQFLKEYGTEEQVSGGMIISGV